MTPGQPRPGDALEFSLDSRRVLVVDDEALLCEMVGLALRHHGCDCETAGSSEAALRLLAESTYDLLLTDWMMPRIAGDALIAEARRIQPTIVCGVMSGYVLSKEMRDLPGGSFFLQKPFRFAELLERIREALANGALR